MLRTVTSLLSLGHRAPVRLGLVVGALRDDGQVDTAAAHALRQAAGPAPLTFHRAFDQVPDQGRALEELIALGYDRVLTTGGHPGTAQVGPLAGLVRQAGDRITVLVSGAHGRQGGPHARPRPGRYGHGPRPGPGDPAGPGTLAGRPGARAERTVPGPAGPGTVCRLPHPPGPAIGPRGRASPPPHLPVTRLGTRRRPVTSGGDRPPCCSGYAAGPGSGVGTLAVVGRGLGARTALTTTLAHICLLVCGLAPRGGSEHEGFSHNRVYRGQPAPVIRCGNGHTPPSGVRK